MIDHPIKAADLLARLDAALPFPTRLTPELQTALRNKDVSASVPATGTIVELFYFGDEGGIMCKLDFGPAAENTTYVSITHLRFDPRLPLSREIGRYQSHRVKRLSRISG